MSGPFASVRGFPRILRGRFHQQAPLPPSPTRIILSSQPARRREVSSTHSLHSFPLRAPRWVLYILLQHHSHDLYHTLPISHGQGPREHITVLLRRIARKTRQIYRHSLSSNITSLLVRRSLQPRQTRPIIHVAIHFSRQPKATLRS